MPNDPREKQQGLIRVRRIRGQIEALERSREGEAQCEPILQQLAAVRGAVNGLMGSVLESHLREELATPAEPNPRIETAIALVRSYLK